MHCSTLQSQNTQLAYDVNLIHSNLQVQSFGLSLGPGENTEKRRSSKCFSKSSHPCLPTFRLFNSALLLKYSQLLVSLIHQKEAIRVTFDIWLWRNIKTNLKEIMMAFVYKQNIIYIFSLHLIQKFITTNQRAVLLYSFSIKPCI